MNLHRVLYVDDLLIAVSACVGDNEEDFATIKRRLSERFQMKDLGIASKVPWHGNRIGKG
jgi:hypothetical protein